MTVHSAVQPATMLILLVAGSFLISLSFGLTPSDSPTAGVCLCSNTVVNIRSSACTNGSILGVLDASSCVQSGGTKVTACGYTWFKMRSNGVDAYVAGQYLDLAASTNCSNSSTTDEGISQQCLDCLCKVEGCKKGCVMDRGSLSCGYFQIKSDYYKDCGSPGAGWKACADDLACATQCVKNYMKRYGKKCTGGRKPTCEDYVKIHNGGPDGCKETGTVDKNWNKVKACLVKAG